MHAQLQGSRDKPLGTSGSQNLWTYFKTVQPVIIIMKEPRHWAGPVAQAVSSVLLMLKDASLPVVYASL